MSAQNTTLHHKPRELGTAGSTENSVYQDHLTSDYSALFSLHTTVHRLIMQYCKFNKFPISFSNISGRTTYIYPSVCLNMHMYPSVCLNMHMNVSFRVHVHTDRRIET